MNELIEIRKNSIDGEARTTTLAIASGTEVEHRAVIQLARQYLDDLFEFGEVAFEMRHNLQGSPTEYALLNEQQSTLLLTYMRNSDVVRQFKKALVKAFYEARQQSSAPAVTDLSRMDILRLAMQSEEARIQAEAERDHAIATKAQIGSRREATAMATAAKAKRESDALKARLGEAAKSASVMAVEGKTKRKFEWRPLRDYCNALELEIGKSFNPGIQREVNTYPAQAWMDVYDVDLVELFGEEVAA